jgi:hypothetical protein
MLIQNKKNTLSNFDVFKIKNNNAIIIGKKTVWHNEVFVKSNIT